MLMYILLNAVLSTDPETQNLFRQLIRTYSLIPYYAAVLWLTLFSALIVTLLLSSGIISKKTACIILSFALILFACSSCILIAISNA